ncbi:uncharacterized protein N7459_006018 [Penicillium hispanicum]|uniref:uncharacterized protein n=1 Tax=Penicillium hispanicum TaxID=1080232 RepID=UPI00253F7B2B|nr:uncharacterized protein N7459_006018 [Penicillium hispanicum]KAJ5580033.1 hypothetical protein N7459_006018 [Penicillium hispanicum]
MPRFYVKRVLEFEESNAERKSPTVSGRKCEYEVTKPGMIAAEPWNVVVLGKQLSSSPTTVWRERRAFAYYFERAAPLLGGELDVDFWRVVVPQVCRSEPAVWDAINSISVLFESPGPGADPQLLRDEQSGPLSQNHRDALSWYSRSVSAVRQRIERGGVDLFVGLVSCVLFICVEALQGGLEEAIRLYSQGVQLIVALRSQIASGDMLSAKSSLLEDTIVPIFVRMGALALSISGVPVVALLRDTEHAPAQEFVSLKAARDAIAPLATEIQIFQGICEEHPFQSRVSGVLQQLMNQQGTLSARLGDWHTSFMSTMARLCTKGALSPQQICVSARLLSYYEMLFVLLEVSISPLQMITDKYFPNFQRIVEQSRIALDIAESDGTQVPFTFELSIGLPLWFTCLRCREPAIRRSALALLRRGPRVQGFYPMTPTLALCERIIALEETYGVPVNTGQEMMNFPSPDSLDATNDFNISKSTASEMGFRAQTAAQIPEEARCGPIVIIRSSGRIPLGMTESHFALLNQGDKSFLQFARNERDPTSGAWQRVYGYVPLDFDI